MMRYVKKYVIKFQIKITFLQKYIYFTINIMNVEKKFKVNIKLKISQKQL